MVSRRNFFTITALLLVILFMFQMIALIKETWNDYDTNAYAKNADSGYDETDVYSSESDAPDEKNTRADAVCYVGDDGADNAAVVQQWATYAKTELMMCASIGELPDDPYLVILADGAVTDAADVEALETLVEEGVHLIFCKLPDISLVKENEALRDLLGVRQVLMDEIELSGIHLFDGFLLGGETVYEAQTEEDEKRQDLELTVPWCYISSGTKTYAMGLLEDQEEYISEELDTENQNELLPAIIWRNSIGDARVFVVNGPYMESVTGVGILQAMLYEIEDYALYPVVNAQNLTVVNAPSLSNENEETLQSLYYRSARALFRDVVWPDITAIGTRSYLTAGCLLTTEMNSGAAESLDAQLLEEHLKTLKEASAEAGFSADRRDDTTLAEKLSSDDALVTQLGSNYAYRALYVPQEDLQELTQETAAPAGSAAPIGSDVPAGSTASAASAAPTASPSQTPAASAAPTPSPSQTPAASAAPTPSPAVTLSDYAYLENIRTVVSDESDSGTLIGYVGDNVTLQRATSGGFTHTYTDDLRLRSLETALGYTHVLVDMERVFWPEDENDQWEKLAEQLSTNIGTYWKPFSSFSATSFSESDQRIRRFLALSYEQEREDDTITLSIENFEEEAWFVLRTHGEEIASIDGGAYTEMEENAYLIQANEQEVRITVRDTLRRTYSDSE